MNDELQHRLMCGFTRGDGIMRLRRMCYLVEPKIAWVPRRIRVKQIRTGGGVFRAGGGVDW